MNKEVLIPIDKITIHGSLHIPQNAKTLVFFAHGSGSGRFSPRNNYVADILNRAHIATILTDLLSEEEDTCYENRFDISLLAQRLRHVIDWCSTQKTCKDLHLSLFGASTGAAAALIVAAVLKKRVQSIVSRGGRPDMAKDVLPHVTAPSLFIVGSNDHGVIELNQSAYERLTCVKKLLYIPGATHLFEEPGCLDQVAYAARDWILEAQRE